MVINLSGTQPQGPKNSETLENKTVDGTQNTVRVNRGNTATRPASPVVGEFYYNTDKQAFEQYTLAGWFNIAQAPSAPTSLVATNQGTGRSFNNGQASVAFTIPTSGGAPSSFIVTPSPSTSPATFTGTSSPITITGLSSSTQYTYVATAVSAYGTSSASTASAGVTSTTVPDFPTNIVANATGNSGEISVSFTPGATGGSTITSYTVTSTPSNIISSGSSSPIIVSGLTNGTSYTFKVYATNINGSSIQSQSSNSMIPVLQPVLTGGTLTSDATYYYRTFTNSDTLTINGGSINADVLVVSGGGGGAGGRDANGLYGFVRYPGGGGGGGGSNLYSSQTLPINNYSIVIGSGGTGGLGTAFGGNGNPSSVVSSGNTIYSTGGGGGGSGSGYSAGNSGIASFGSGGGGAGQSVARSQAVTSSSGGLGDSGSGNGGSGAATTGTAAGGGGGGRSTSGNSGSGQTGGSGGNGSSYLGTVYSGGGGGGSQGNITPASGGSGGGGAGGSSNTSNASGSSGTINTGGGGGGGGAYDNGSGNDYYGGTGGSGKIIFRYTRSQVGG